MGIEILEIAGQFFAFVSVGQRVREPFPSGRFIAGPFAVEQDAVDFIFGAWPD